MLKDYIRIILLFMVLLVIQLTIIPFIAVDYIVPNILMIMIIYYTLVRGQIFGSVLGFIVGFIYDLASGSLLGSSMFSMTLGAFIAGYFFNENKIEFNVNSFIFILILFIGSAIYSFISAALVSSSAEVSIIFLFFEQGILPGFYTALLGLPVVIFKKREILK